MDNIINLHTVYECAKDDLDYAKRHLIKRLEAGIDNITGYSKDKIRVDVSGGLVFDQGSLSDYFSKEILYYFQHEKSIVKQALTNVFKQAGFNIYFDKDKIVLYYGDYIFVQNNRVVFPGEYDKIVPDISFILDVIHEWRKDNDRYIHAVKQLDDDILELIDLD